MLTVLSLVIWEDYSSLHFSKFLQFSFIMLVIRKRKFKDNCGQWSSVSLVIRELQLYGKQTLMEANHADRGTKTISHLSCLLT